MGYHGLRLAGHMRCVRESRSALRASDARVPCDATVAYAGASTSTRANNVLRPGAGAFRSAAAAAIAWFLGAGDVMPSAAGVPQFAAEVAPTRAEGPRERDHLALARLTCAWTAASRVRQNITASLEVANRHRRWPLQRVRVPRQSSCAATPTSVCFLLLCLASLSRGEGVAESRSPPARSLP